MAFLEPLDGAGHDPYYPPYDQQFYQQSDYFFYDVLDLGHAAGQPASVRASAAREQRFLAKRYPRYARVMRARQRALASSRR